MTAIRSADLFQVWVDSPFFEAGSGSTLVAFAAEGMSESVAPLIGGGALGDFFARGVETQAPLAENRRVVGASRKSFFDHYLDGTMSSLQRPYQQDQVPLSKIPMLRWQTSDLSTHSFRWEDLCSLFLRRATNTSHARKGLFPPRYGFGPDENGLVVWVGPEVLLPTPGGRAIRTMVVNGDFDLAVPFEMAHIYRDCLPECEHRIVPAANTLAEFSGYALLPTGRLIPLSRWQTLRMTHMAGHWGGWLRNVFMRFVENLLVLLPRGVMKSFVFRPFLWLANRASLRSKRKRRAGRAWDPALKIEVSA